MNGILEGMADEAPGAVKHGGSTQDAGFRDCEFMKASEKASVVADMRKLIAHVKASGAGGAAPRAFSERLYAHVSMHCGHIAHMDREGFWRAQLGTAQRAREFFEGMAAERMVMWSVADYRDVNRALAKEVRAAWQVLEGLLRQQARVDAMSQIAEIAKASGLSVAIEGVAAGQEAERSVGQAQEELF